MDKKHIWKKFIVIFIFAVLISGIVEIFANFNVIFSQNHENKNLSKINATLSGFKHNNLGYILKKKEGVLKWQLDGLYVNKLCFDYENAGMLNVRIDVGVNNALGKEEVISIEDHNPLLLNQSIVNIHKKANWISITTENANKGMVIKNVKIKNSITLNKYRILTSALLVILCLFLYFERGRIKENLEWGVAAVALTMGIIFAVSLPTNKIGWDEETHFKMAYQMSVYPGGEMLPEEIASQLSTDTLYNYPSNQPQSLEEKQELNAIENYIYKDGERNIFVQGKLCGIYTPGLILQSIAIKLTRNLGMPFSKIFLSGRIMALILYVFVMFWAIRIIPFGKRMLTFISLSPTSIFLAVTYTYDTVVFSFVSLGIAIVINEWMNNEKINIKMLIWGVICLGIGCLPKAVYAPILLLILFIPKEKYEKKNICYIVRCIYLFVLLMLLLTFVLPQISNPGAATDVRFMQADSGEQMALVLKHPIGYIGIVLKNVFRTLPDYVFGLDAYRLIGHIGESGFLYLVPIMVVFCLSTDYSETYMKKVSIKQRIEIFIILGVIIGLVWTALYLSFNAVGITRIEGVQGRYYRPLLWLIYMIFANKYVKLQISNKRYNQFVLGIGLLIIGVTVLKVFAMYCI